MPLASHSRDIEHLGSRHRAAVGVSENSDALVLVVSEETGTVSIAYKGSLTRHFTEETLYDTLYSFFTQQNVKIHLQNARKGKKKNNKGGKVQNEQ